VRQEWFAGEHHMRCPTPAQATPRKRHGPDSTLVLQRRTGESLFMFSGDVHPGVEGAPVVPALSGLVKITVVGVDGDTVTLAVTGPDDLPVRAEEGGGPAA
jgi:sRNA-binding carbon storage regulator CsrA